MSVINPTDVPIHELLSRRKSPYAFDPNKTVSKDDLIALFEAARWTMSSYNAQPWRYIVGVKDRSPEVWQQIYSVLLEGNQPWASNAPVLVLGLTEHTFEHNGQNNKAAQHDLGAASAYLTLEATARGLYVHQMIGIDPDKARQVFGISGSLEPLTGMAIGYLGAPTDVAETFAQRDQRERQRKALSEIVLKGSL
ncbi:nitroreductase family protein [Gynuella sunshinyii]|uniref:Nitroreductase n=1 Tax=Gynuella sunshinyii YC6258 TaxID=1445510 RepID=A0A0C5VD31_9GAMM|nr:nitroreductase family protein [Gynuella sunshinyii]AJQ92437.1 nitroreductase [Gynuella sunshinyii YC6258]